MNLHGRRLGGAGRFFSGPRGALVHLRNDDLELRMFTMLTTLGTPLDLTAAELRIETSFPADDATEQALRGWATTA